MEVSVMAHKLVVVSFDSLQSDDIETLKTMPNFSEILKKSAMVKQVRPVYPTLTYPIHTTMITGVAPKEHGIIHNQIPGLKRKNPDWSIYGSDWYWYKKDIKVPTLLDVAAQKGKKVANILWPVTAGAKDFLNVPPIWPDKKQDPKELMRHAMSEEAFERFYFRYHSHYNWGSADDMHNYGAEIALEIWEQDQPDILMHHVEHLDCTRHLYGDKGKQVDECLRQLDIIMGRYIMIAERTGVLQDTNFVFLGDHGQIDVENVFALNRLFVEEGFIQLDEENQPIDYQAYSSSAGFSSQVFLKNPDDKNMYQKVYDFLERMRQRYPQYIEKIYCVEELKEEGIAAEGLCFMVEGTRGTLLDKKMSGDLVVNTENFGYTGHLATHGHHPDKQPQPPFIAFGPDICPGIVVQQGDIMDICPTLAALSQIDFPQAKGKPFPIIR